jgi:DNA-binding NtrC family response regulator
MQDLFDEIERVAPTDATVLLTGETGTGKEVTARTIHRFSRRAHERFLPVNCGAVAPTLIESEVFGHERGSFTGAVNRHAGMFERADGGTLFLDEITEMSPELQVKLLRILEGGEVVRIGSRTSLHVDVRVIAATNRDPREAVREGRLREDLLYRLMVFPIVIPPLRERGQDVLLLAQTFLDELNEKHGTDKRLDPTASGTLAAHSWPGNVRELRNVVERAFILSRGDTIEAVSIPLPHRAAAPAQDDDVVSLPVGTTLADAERALILATLKRFGNAKTKAAAALGVSVKTIYNRLKEYGAGETDAGDSGTVDEEVESIRDSS